MSEEAAKGGWWTPIRVGLILTALVLVGFIVMAFQLNCVLFDTTAIEEPLVLECQRNWKWFWASKPNEIGDTLAGFAGTLAFIWIVATVWLQSSELAEQRQVLTEQRKEFELMVQAQNAQVIALNAQAEIFRDEKRRRDQLEVARILEELLKDSLDLIYRTRNIAWRTIHSDNSEANLFGELVPLNQTIYGGGTFDEFSLQGLVPSLRLVRERLKVMTASGESVVKPERPEELKLASLILIEINGIDSLADNPMQIRVRRWNAGNLADTLLDFYHDQSLWGVANAEATP